jgi:hypothetical protein
MSVNVLRRMSSIMRNLCKQLDEFGQVERAMEISECDRSQLLKEVGTLGIKLGDEGSCPSVVLDAIGEVVRVARSRVLRAASSNLEDSIKRTATELRDGLLIAMPLAPRKPSVPLETISETINRLRAMAEQSTTQQDCELLELASQLIGLLPTE